jgi:simple sugar transport system permease protein
MASCNEERLQPGGLARFARRSGLQIGIVLVAVIVWVLFLIGSPQTFLAFPIYQAFMSTTPFFAMMALPLTLVIIAAEIDLSFPSVMAFGMTIFTLILRATNSLTLAFVGCLLAGLLAGVVNGLLVVRIGIPSLVATIGTQFFWRGVVLVITGGNGRSLVSAQGSLLYGTLVGRLGGRIPAQMLWTIIVAFVMWLFLNRHRFGAHVYLIGDNVESAKLMGVNAARTKLLVFAIMGVAAAFAGLVVSLEVLYFWPTMGEGYLLSTLSSVFLGGTSVFGGTGTVFGTFVASFIIGAINAGIVAAGLAGFWTQLIYGLIIVASVSMHAVLRRRLA